MWMLISISDVTGTAGIPIVTLEGASLALTVSKDEIPKVGIFSMKKIDDLW